MTLHSLSAYGKAFQIKVLYSLLHDKKFLLTVRDVIDSTFFDFDAHQWIIEVILKYFDEYNTVITHEALGVEVKKITNNVLMTAVKQELRNCFNSSNEDSEYIQEEFTSFCRNQKMKQAILTSTNLLKLNDFDGIRSLIEGAMKAGTDKDLGHEYTRDVESRFRDDYRPVIPFPWNELNEVTQGGMGPGDLVTIFGNPGGGKCISGKTEIQIEYEEYGVQLKNNKNEPFIMWVRPWDEFNIEGNHMYGWQIKKLFES